MNREGDGERNVSWRNASVPGVAGVARVVRIGELVSGVGGGGGLVAASGDDPPNQSVVGGPLVPLLVPVSVPLFWFPERSGSGD